MNKIIKFFLTKKQERKYIKYIEEHRNNVQKAFIEMINNPNLLGVNGTEDLYCQLKDRIDNHDISKYSIEEFDAYRKHYYPINLGEKVLGEENFNKAWEHHGKNNRHHGEARQNDQEQENGLLTEEQKLDCLENILDGLAMGYKFHDRPYTYFLQHEQEIKLPEIQKDFIKKLCYDLETSHGIDDGVRI